MNACKEASFSLVRVLILTLSLLVSGEPHQASAAPRLADIKAAAEAGDAQAQDSLAEAYRSQLDHTNATIWYRKAAAQGVANSQYQLGQTLIYEATSPLVKIDSKTARAAEGFELLRQAAHQDYKRAQLHLGRLYQEGKIVPQDFVEAYTWFALAGQGGSLDPSSMEGRMYRDRLILKMSQSQIAEAEAQAKSFVPGSPPATQVAQPTYLQGLRLQGISGPAKRRLAIINGQTFAAGEGGPVKIGDSWLYVTCLSITTNSARVKLQNAGVTVDLKLGGETAPQLVPPPSANSPVKQVAPPQPQPQPKKPVRQSPSALKQRYATAPDSKLTNPSEVLTSLFRKLILTVVGVALLGTFLILGFVAVVPVMLKGLTSPDQSSARTRGPNSRSPIQSPTEPAPVVKRVASHEDVMERLQQLDWFQLEKVVEIVFRKRGYEVERCGGANPDGGVDLFVQKDGQRQAIQCKHWKNSDVGVKTVREFLGAIKDAGLERGMFVALGGYTEPARELAAKHEIELIDGMRFTAMLKDAHARYDPELIALLDDQRKFCPKCGNQMVIRTAQKGRNAGSTFWGCTRFPRCRFILRQ